MIASSVSMRLGYYLPLEDKTLVLHDKCDIFCHYTVTLLVVILIHSKCSCKKKYEKLCLNFCINLIVCFNNTNIIIHFRYYIEQIIHSEERKVCESLDS